MSTTTRVTESQLLTMGLRKRGREQLASRSREAARSGTCAFMSAASRCRTGTSDVRRTFL